MFHTIENLLFVDEIPVDQTGDVRYTISSCNQTLNTPKPEILNPRFLQPCGALARSEPRDPNPETRFPRSKMFHVVVMQRVETVSTRGTPSR